MYTCEVVYQYENTSIYLSVSYVLVKNSQEGRFFFLLKGKIINWTDIFMYHIETVSFVNFVRVLNVSRRI